MPRTRGPNNATSPIVRDIIELVDRSGWKDWEVCMVAGVSLPYLSQLRGGKRHDISTACLEAILGVFGRKLTFTKATPGSGAPKQKPKPKRATKTGSVVRQKISYAGADPNER